MTSHEQSSEDEVVVISRKDMQEFNEGSILPESPEAQAEISAWLQPTSYAAENSECSKHRASHLDGTGDWLWKSPGYEHWHTRNDHGMLLIKGIPGSGKSVIAGSLVDRLSREGVPVLYFFFRQIIDANHAPIALLRDWLDQVLAYSPPLQARLKEYVDKKQLLTYKSINDLWGYLKLALVHLPKVYCVVDALDEMDSGNDDFLRALAEFGQWRPAHIKVVATSRPVPRVEIPIRQIPMLQLRLEEKIVDIDIATYVQHRLLESTIPKEHHQEIKDAVPGRANGLFLYARLAMDAFLKDGADVLQVMENLPADLNILYTDLLRQHVIRSGISGQLQLLILSWVTHASRPLRLLEIAEMLSKMENTDLGLKDSKELVRTSCGPLLEILPDETISVIHHSLTEFLNGSTRKPDTATPPEPKSYPVLDMGTTHTRLARTCIKYILDSKCLDTVEIRKKDTEPEGELPGTKELRSEHPFLAYCLEYWHVHARKADSHIELSEELLHDLDELVTTDKCPALETLTRLKVKAWTPIHMAAGYGLSQFVARLIAKGEFNVNSIDGDTKKPLIHASQGGHAATVKLLLANGADPDEPSNDDGAKPLHWAALSNNGETVKLLLEAGVDPMTKKTGEDPDWYPVGAGTTGYTPLMHAFLDGHEESARAFIPYLKTKKHVFRAFVWAAEGRRGALVEEMLKHPMIDVNVKVRGQTALFHAAERKDVDTMIALLEAGADPSIYCMGWYDEFEDYDTEDEEDFEDKEDASDSERDDDDDDEEDSDNDNEDDSEDGVNAVGHTGTNALHALCGRQEWSERELILETESIERLISTMIQAGLDINAASASGNALKLAATNMPALVGPLLRVQGNVSTRGPGDTTMLHGCTDPDVVQVFVREGNLDINAVAEFKRTPLLYAAYRRNLTPELVKRYAELGADMTRTDLKGQGPLHLVVGDGIGTFNLILALLEAGVPPNMKNHKGETALHLIALPYKPSFRPAVPGEPDSTAVATALVAAGADLNARDNEGQTPLFRYAKKANDSDLLEFVQNMIDLGADPKLLDFRGRDLLFFMHKTNRDKTTELALSWGLDPNATDYNGNPRNWSHAEPGHVNNTGQNYLHIEAVRSSSTVKVTAFKNFDDKDNAGIRPLHLAIQSSNGLAERLLAAGASPTDRTHAGTSPLHVAAAYGQPNMVGQLLEIIKFQRGEEYLKRHLNRTNHYSNTGFPSVPTALQFACGTGMPETVSLLLAAGADPNAYIGLQSPLSGCLMYENRDDDEELKCIEPGLGGKSSSWDKVKGSGTVSRQTDLPRLEPILDMLHLHGNISIDVIDTALRKSQGYDYTTECLVDLRRRILDEQADKKSNKDETDRTELEAYVDGLLESNETQSAIPSFHDLAGVYRRAVTRREFIRSNSNMTYAAMVVHHQWELLLHKAKHDPELFKLGLYRHAPFTQFVSWGLDSVVRELLTPQHMRELEATHEEHIGTKLSGEPVFAHEYPIIKPLLLQACERTSGNMPMLRCLVEEFDANVNMQDLAIVGPKNNKTYLAGAGPLHVLAKSRYWWAGAQGIAYLVDHGASVELRDHLGRTPLILASTVRSARALLECGADVNAQDAFGNNALTYGIENMDMVKLLLSHGATVQSEAIHKVMGERNVNENTPDLLDILFTKIDANSRMKQSDKNSARNPSQEKNVPVEKYEMYPLYLAAAPNPMALRSGSRITYEKTTIQKQNLPMIKVILKHGADPYVKYLKRNDTAGQDEAKDSYEEVTLLHDLLETGGLVAPLIEMPDLNLNFRDAKGRTPLLAACRNKLGSDTSVDGINPGFLGNLNAFHEAPEAPGRDITAIRLLINRGACVTVRDNAERNALHHILQSKPTGGSESLSLLISLAPELVNQVDTFDASPLLYALQRLSSPDASDARAVRILLDAGADPHVQDAQQNNALHLLAARFAGQGWLDDDFKEIQQLFQEFLRLGVPIDARNDRGETPIFSFVSAQGKDIGHTYVAEKDNERQRESLEAFAAAGADFSAVDDERNTLLHVVASTNAKLHRRDAGEVMVRRFQWILNKGLNAMAENTRYQTCLDVATANSNQTVLKLFERKE